MAKNARNAAVPPKMKAARFPAPRFLGKTPATSPPSASPAVPVMLFPRVRPHPDPEPQFQRKRQHERQYLPRSDRINPATNRDYCCGNFFLPAPKQFVLRVGRPAPPGMSSRKPRSREKTNCSNHAKKPSTVRTPPLANTHLRGPPHHLACRFETAAAAPSEGPVGPGLIKIPRVFFV